MKRLNIPNMKNYEISSLTLEKHVTKAVNDGHPNGNLTVIWRDWDNFMTDPPKMIYISSVNPHEIKGPHLHTKRNSFFVCIHGKVVFIIKEKSGKYIEVESGEENPVLVIVPKGVPSAHMNISDKISRVLAMADVAWKPNDDEMKNITFDNYDWKKWKGIN